MFLIHLRYIKVSICIIQLVVICATINAVGKYDARNVYPDQFAPLEQIETKFQDLSPNFQYIRPNGHIHDTFEGNKDELMKKFSPDIKHLKTDDFYIKEFSISEISKGQIPTINLKETVNWEQQDKNYAEYISLGEDFFALGFKTQKVIYYRYNGKNPLFPAHSLYNNKQYTTLENETENVLDRFIFFRWTGKNMGITLDTYMFAIDTYTGLVFTYVKIGSWENAFGVEIPSRYDPIDAYKTYNNQPHLFFEYDPIGYISKDGELILYDWYIKKTQEKLEVQLEAMLPIGKSPYYVP